MKIKSVEIIKKEQVIEEITKGKTVYCASIKKGEFGKEILAMQNMTTKSVNKLVGTEGSWIAIEVEE